MRSFCWVWVGSGFWADGVSVLVTNENETENEDGGVLQSDDAT